MKISRYKLKVQTFKTKHYLERMCVDKNYEIFSYLMVSLERR